jgi:cell division protein FtsB
VTRPRPVPGAGWLVAAVLGVLLVAALFGDNGVLHLRRLRTELQDLHREVQGLEAENARLGRAIADLRDNPEVIERIAREQLGLVRPGERVLRFPRTSGPEASPGTPLPNPPRSP